MKKEILKPFKKNDELVVEIIRYGSNGEGIAVEQGIVIFVQHALVGEIVKIHIINDKNSYLIAKVVEILKPSEKRKNPACPYYYKCGGCDLQHMNDDEQNKTINLNSTQCWGYAQYCFYRFFKTFHCKTLTLSTGFSVTVPFST